MNNKSAVTEIFNQLTAGTNPRLNFPADHKIRAAFIPVAAHVIDGVNQRLTDNLAPALQQHLVLKLATYCLRHELLVPHSGPNLNNLLPDIVEAIADRPMRLETQSIRGILNAHVQMKRQQAAETRRRFTQQVESSHKPVSLLWENLMGYTLVELHTPSHLKAETLALDHCIGSRYNMAAIVQKNITRGTNEEDQYLQYAIKMRRGECRIFSLRAPDGMPVATMRYDKQSQSMIELEGKDVYIARSSTHFKPLCKALASISRLMPVAKIHGLPPLQLNNEYCDQNGDFHIGNGTVPTDMLYGRIVVPEGMAESELHKLAANPRLTLTMPTLAEGKRLPRHIKADLLFSSADMQGSHLDLSHVETAADILAECKSVDLSALRKCDDLYFPWLQKFAMPVAKQTGSISSGCHAFAAPMLRESGHLCIPNVDSDLYLPHYRRGLNLDIGTNAGRYWHASLPQLKHCLVLLCGAFSANLSALEYSDELDLRRASEANLRRLMATGDFKAPELKQLDAPELVETGVLYLPGYRDLRAAKLQTSTGVTVHETAHVDVPALEMHVPFERAQSIMTIRQRMRLGLNQPV